MFAQLYILDSEEAVNERMNIWSNNTCDRQLMSQHDQLMRQVNPFAEAYKMMHELENEKDLRIDLRLDFLRTFHVLLNWPSNCHLRANLPSQVWNSITNNLMILLLLYRRKWMYNKFNRNKSMDIKNRESFVWSIKLVPKIII